MPLTEQQRERADSLRWYHAIDFGNYQTRGRSAPSTPANKTLYGVMDMLAHVDLKGMRCLEIGPAHGLISIGMAIKGAQVTACDIGGKKPPKISLCEEVFGVSIDYRSPISLEKVPSHFAPGTFDCILCAGVMYHLINPADVFFRLRPLLKQNGLLLMETVYAAKINEPVIVLNSEMTVLPQVTTYFVPSASALVGMAKLACFDVLATRMHSPSRCALLGRAVPPHQVAERSDFCKQIHEFGFEDPMFNVSRLAEAPSSLITYNGELGEKAIDTRTYVPSFPPHPTKLTSPIGLEFKAASHR